jgi:hypothetical protein
MKQLWRFLDGKKTTISAIIFLGGQVFRVMNGETIDPVETAASLIAILGLGHKVLKTAEKLPDEE